MPRPVYRIVRKISQARNSQSRQGKFSLSFSWPVIGGLGLVLLCAIVWSFFMGFMVGKGQNPQARLREMAGINANIATEEQDISPTAPEILAENTPDASPTHEPANEPQVPPPANSGKALAFRTPEGAGLDAWGKSAPVPEKTAKKTPSADRIRPVAAANNEPIFDYSFQIAAFKSRADAEKAEKILAGKGLRCRIRKSGKVQLLLASLRGNAAVEKDLRQKVKSAKLGEPLLLSKKSVTVKKHREK